MRLSLANTTLTVIKLVRDVSPGQQTPENIPKSDAEKDEFLKHGILPTCHLKTAPQQGTEVRKRKHVGVSFEFLPEAKRILDTVNASHGNGDTYLDRVFGERISQSKASKYLTEYLQRQGLDGALRILWSKDMNCCGRIIWTGPSVRLNKPEKRRYTLWLNSTPQNVFLRQQGIKGLADHEIGTHYLRMLNDGFQPWFSNRQTFGLRGLNSRHLKVTEEGLAALNTLLQFNCRLLWRPAFLYYTACMAIKMTFRELFDHLETYIRDPDQRWKHVMRVKRYLEDCSGYGGNGKDQSYFAGAVRILRKADEIDFKLLYSGKLCFDDLKRIKRISRASIKLPHFLEDINLYRHTLKEILHVNGLQSPVIMHCLYPKPRLRKYVEKNTKRKTTTTRTVVTYQARKPFGRKGHNKRQDFSGYASYDLFSIKELLPKLVY